MINVLTVEGDLISGCESSTRRTSTLRSLGSMSSAAGAAAGKRGKPTERLYRTYFASRDWKAMAAILADDIFTDDRRRVVNAGVRQGRDAETRKLADPRRPWRHDL